MENYRHSRENSASPKSRRTGGEGEVDEVDGILDETDIIFNALTNQMNEAEAA